MHIEIENRKHYIFVQFKRTYTINSANIDEFKTQVLKNIELHKVVIFNFEKLDFIDSAGLTVLIHIRRKILDAKGEMKIVNAGERILKLLQITRLHKVFEIYENLNTAEKSIEKKSQDTKQTSQYTIHVQVKHTDSFSVVRIIQPDSLIKANASQFKIKVIEYLKRQNTIIINFSNIRNIDSAGIAALIGLKRYSRQQKKKIILVYNNRVLNRLFKLYSLDDLFSQFQTEEEAIYTVKPMAISKQVNRKPKQIEVESKPVAAGIGSEFSDIVFLCSQNQ